MHNWFAGVQREIGLGIVAELNYLGSAGRHLHNAYNINRYVGDLIDGRFDGFNPSFSSINMVTSTSRSDYQGGTLQLRRNFRQGFMLQGAWTFGQAKNDADAAVGNTAFQDAANIGADRSVAGYDVAHKLALAGVWELPFLKDSTGWQKALFAGWQIAGSAIFQTGTPINVTHGGAYPTGDFNADGAGGDRPERPGPERQDVGLEPGGVPRRHLPRERLPAAGRRAERQPATQRLSRSGLRRRQPVVLEEVRGVADGVGRVPRRCVQRVQSREPLGSEHGSEQHELRQVDLAAEHAGDSVGGSRQVLKGRHARLDLVSRDAE